MTLEWKNNIGAAAILLAGLAVGCGGAGSSTAPSGSGSAATVTPGTTNPSGALVVPADYYLDTIRTCVTGVCGTRSVPAALFTISSTGVVQSQMRAFIQFSADRTFHFESVQRTDANGVKGLESTIWGDGTYNVTDSLIGFKSNPGTVGPGTVTINTDGTLARFYNIPIEPPFTPQIIEVMEIYRLLK